MLLLVGVQWTVCRAAAGGITGSHHLPGTRRRRRQTTKIVDQPRGVGVTRPPDCKSSICQRSCF